VIRLSGQDLSIDELRELAKAALPYSRNATEANAVLMTAELAPRTCGPVAFEEGASPTCTMRAGARQRWFDDSAVYRQQVLGKLLRLACEEEAIAPGVARNPREMWGPDASAPARAMLGRVGKCTGLRDPAEGFRRDLEADARGEPST
jgi:hypothetical protein